MKLHRYLISAILLLFINQLHSQEGHIFISNFQVDNSVFDSKVTSIEFDEAGLAYVAGRKGVAIFDGVKWTQIKQIPANVSEIKFDTATNKMFVGIKDEIGELIFDSNGRYKYKSLHKFFRRGLLFNKIYLTTDKAYFYSDRLIYVLSKENPEQFDSIPAPGQAGFSGIIKRKEIVYVNIPGKGFHKIDGSSLKPIKTTSDLKTSTVLFSTDFNNKNILFGTNKNKIYLFDGIKFIQFAEHTEIRDFLQENILWDGIDFSGKYFAVTTLTGGCAIIDKSYGKIVNVINYQTGLPDDEVFTIARDINKGIWLAHESGVSRCDPNLPLKYYSTYPGLNGNINDILVKNGILYAATSEGVFSLNRFNYRQAVNKNSGYSGRKATSNQQNQSKKAYIQQSITHQFNKIENLDEKCKKIYTFGKNLIALTNYGVYEIVGNKAIPVKTNIYPNDIHVSTDTSIVYVATLDGVYELYYSVNKRDKSKVWKSRKIIRQIKSHVYSIAQDKAHNLFLGLDSQALICMPGKNGSYSMFNELILPEPTHEPINLIQNRGDVYFIQATGIFVYNGQKEQVLYHDIRSITTKNLQYIAGKQNAWIKEDEEWKPVTKMQFDVPTELLSIFKNIRNIYIDKNNETWLVTGMNSLLKVQRQGVNSFDYSFKLEVRSVQDNTDSLYNINQAIIPYMNNAINVNLAAPFYLRPEAVQYQFRILGLKNYEDWSDWSLNSNIGLSSVNSGRYVLNARAKNVFNQVSDEKEISIRILKPFWRTKSFFIISVVSFLALVGLVFYITHRNLLRKKRVLEQKVQERTVELQEEKDKTEALLLNILPKETADELKKFNKVVPRNYDNATILFTDFKGFTHIAEKLSPEELVNEIDHLFKEFDAIIGKYRIEKIKTIGDAYMCAGGLPTKFKNNSLEVVKAALEIRDYMKQYRIEREKEGIPFFEIRIGIHTGKVVAGVVGTRKYAYDIWGDAVNLASRMESSGEPGKVNVSGDTYKLIKDKFDCHYRGKIEAKNKGEVDMYFVDGLKKKKSR